jgi:zinc D-Ala-D-Ala carboxypeptidase
MPIRPRTAVFASLAVLGGLAAAATAARPPGRWFSWEELQSTAQRFPNVAGGPARVALRNLTEHSLDPFREYLGRSVGVNSAFRNKVVNRLVGGAKDSQHTRGEAADIEVPGMSSAELASAYLASGLPFDQIVWYEARPHLHVSYRAGRLRGEVRFQPVTGRTQLRRPA